MNNSAIHEGSGDGGGLAFGDSTNSSINNCTISNNFAYYRGGGIFYFGQNGTRTIANSILWDNRAQIGSEILVHSGPAPSVTYTDVKGGGFSGAGNKNADPKFCSASANNYHLTASPGISPCINSGNNTGVSSTDLDGHVRVVGGTVDMGCYEYQGSGTGCESGGVTLACPAPGCPTASIFSASPADSQRDARRPHPEGGTGTPVDPTTRTGIGSRAAGNLEPVTITLKNGGTLVSGATQLGCWGLCETGVETVESPTSPLTANFVYSVRETSTGVYSIFLDRPISAGNWTTLKYLGGSNYVAYASLPSDVNIDGYAAPNDIIALIDCINYPLTCPGAHPYRTDIDHSGQPLPPDITMEIDLLNGTGNFIAWQGKQLATNTTCPGGTMLMADYSETVASEQDPAEVNQEIADWLVAYLSTADPMGGTEVEDFEFIVDELTQWCVDSFTVDEQNGLADRLSDSTLSFASEIGANAAALMAAVLNP